MEFCSGKSLADYIKDHIEETEVRRREVPRLLRHISKGLSAIHAQGIVHRDFKPNNIFSTKQFTWSAETVWKIGDFGLSIDRGLHSLNLDLDVHEDPSHGGMHGYHSPELLKGQTFNEKSDVYSLGMVILETIFPGKYAPKRGSGNTDYNLVPDIPDDKVLMTLLKTMLAPSDDDRPDALSIYLTMRTRSAFKFGPDEEIVTSTYLKEPITHGGKREGLLKLLDNHNNVEPKLTIAFIDGVVGGWCRKSGFLERTTEAAGVTANVLWLDGDRCRMDQQLFTIATELDIPLKQQGHHNAFRQDTLLVPIVQELHQLSPNRQTILVIDNVEDICNYSYQVECLKEKECCPFLILLTDLALCFDKCRRCARDYYAWCTDEKINVEEITLQGYVEAQEVADDVPNTALQYDTLGRFPGNLALASRLLDKFFSPITPQSVTFYLDHYYQNVEDLDIIGGAFITGFRQDQAPLFATPKWRESEQVSAALICLALQKVKPFVAKVAYFLSFLDPFGVEVNLAETMIKRAYSPFQTPSVMKALLELESLGFLRRYYSGDIVSVKNNVRTVSQLLLIENGTQKEMQRRVLDSFRLWEYPSVKSVNTLIKVNGASSSFSFGRPGSVFYNLGIVHVEK